MKSILRQFFALVIFCAILPVNSYAWNAVGHTLVASIAYERLKPSVKAKVDKMTQDLSKEYPNVTQFQQLGPWPDSLRGQHIDVFTHWHYVDIAFSADVTPIKDLSDDDNIVWAIKQITPIVGNASANPYERARFLAFLVHFVGDIHQPLHTVSRISAAHPNGDQGGNLYRIVTTQFAEGSGNNLHSLWDNGVGLFGSNLSPDIIKSLARTITTQYPESYFGDKVNNLKTEDWSKEGVQVAKTVVYNTPEGKMPSPSYMENGKQTAEQQVALAGYRLAALLNKVLDK